MTDLILVLAIITAMTISATVILIVNPWAIRFGLVDKPNTRKIQHARTIPLIGGLGIVAGTLGALTLTIELDRLVQSYVLGTLILFAFGVWDDANESDHKAKFLGQILAVCIVVFYGGLWVRYVPFADQAGLPIWLGIPLTIFALIGLINAINTSDGLDGLAAGESLLSLIIICALAAISASTEVLVIALAAVGGILGFLRFNTYPAQIFMGDNGSQNLGFTLGFLVVLLTQIGNHALSPAIVLFILGLPLVDLFYVMALRLAKGANPFHADKNHLHHCLMACNYNHYETVVLSYSLHLMFIICAYFLRYENDALVLSVYVLICTLIYGTFYLMQHKGWFWQRPTPTSATTAFISLIKDTSLLTRIPVLVIGIAMPVYLLFASLSVVSVSWDLGIAAAVISLIFAIDLILRNSNQPGKGNTSTISKIAIYCAAMFVAYTTISQTGAHGPYSSTFNMVFFTLLCVAIGLIVIYGASARFVANPTDYLIILGLLVIGLFGKHYVPMKGLSEALIKGVILLYSCEILILRGQRLLSILNLSALITLSILGIRGLSLV